MFRLSGKKVELIRYVVSWSESIDGENQSMTEWCVSEKHRDEIIAGLNDKKIKYAVEDIDQTANEWVDGLSFDNYDTAKQALEAGESLGKAMARIDVKDKIKALETENTLLKARLAKVENTTTVKSELTKEVVAK